MGRSLSNTLCPVHGRVCKCVRLCVHKELYIQKVQQRYTCLRVLCPLCVMIQ